jgi:hypothetical protein
VGFRRLMAPFGGFFSDVQWIFDGNVKENKEIA